jgi:hypothetical protein
MDVSIRTQEGLLEAYVFEEHIEGGRVDEIKEAFAGTSGVQFVGQFVGSFSLFARVVATELSELQDRIKGEYWEAGIHSSWSLILTGGSAVAPKRASADLCALVCARAQGDPFAIWESLDATFLDKEPAKVQRCERARLRHPGGLGSDTIEVRSIGSARSRVRRIGRTSTAVANLAATRSDPPRAELAFGGRRRASPGPGRTQARHHAVRRPLGVHGVGRVARPRGGLRIPPADDDGTPVDRRVLRRHRSPIQGDGFMAVFGVPVAHEDDPERRCAPPWMCAITFAR